MNIFKGVVVGVFAVLALIAVVVFATLSTGGSGSRVGTVVMWGTLPESTVEEVLYVVQRSDSGMRDVSYRGFPESSFSNTLVEAIASGRGPDLVLMPVEFALGDADKLTTISYSSYPRRDFLDSFIEAGEVLLVPEGILGLPFSIDPFVLFWNRTLFSGAGIPRPPRFWDEITDLAPRLSRATQGGTLTQSAIALGEWSNVNSAKKIFLSLVFGLGNRVIVRDTSGALRPIFADRLGEVASSPAESAVRYFADFADPVKTVYSWNRSRPNSFDAFTAGVLAMYLGPASDITLIRAANPNLNFDIAQYPEVRGGAVATPARMHVLSVPRGSRNPVGALRAAAVLTSPETQRILVSETGLPSVRRDVLSVSPENPYEGIFRNAALSAFIFLDPNPTETDAIFRRVIEGVTSGRLRITEAVRGGQEELQVLLRVR